MKLKKRIGIAALVLIPDVSFGEQLSSEAKRKALMLPEQTNLLGAPPAPETRRAKPHRVTGLGVVPAPKSRPKPSPIPPPQVLKAVADWGGLYAEFGTGTGAVDGMAGVAGGVYFQEERIVFGINIGYEYGFGGPAHWIGTATGRFGYAASDHFLPFVSFGATYADLAGKAPFAAHNTGLGWTIGVGFDYRIDRDWSAIAAVNLFSFSVMNSFAGPMPRENFGEVRAGLKYRFPPTSLTR